MKRDNIFKINVKVKTNTTTDFFETSIQIE